MDHYSDSTNGFSSINIKSTAAEDGRVTSQLKINQLLLLLQLNYTENLLLRRNRTSTKGRLCGKIFAASKIFCTICLVCDCTEEKKESNEVNKSMCEWMRTSVQKRNECT